MVAINGLSSVLLRLTSTTTAVEMRQASTVKALTDVACALGKCQSAITQFKEVMEEMAKRKGGGKRDGSRGKESGRRNGRKIWSWNKGGK